MNKNKHDLLIEIIKRVDFLQQNYDCMHEMSKIGFSHDHILHILNLVAAYQLLDQTSSNDQIIRKRLDTMILDWVIEFNRKIELILVDDMPKLDKLRILI